MLANHFRFLLASTLLVSMFYLPNNVLNAQEKAPVELQDTYNVGRVAIVNIERVLRDAMATERVRLLLDNKREEFQNDFATREASLLQIEKDLQSKRTLLSEEAYRAEVNQFQNEVASIQKEIQFKRQALDKAFQEAQDEIRSLALEIVAEVAVSQRLDLVLNKNAALVFRQDINVTDAVIAELNERTKNARLEIQEE
ncbi:OmpH family outer membrane protein [Alphaproteobacteria bacterium]|nr:OmpH family outer membrane protein [Alphaproteobacteria bacterium]